MLDFWVLDGPVEEGVTAGLFVPHRWFKTVMVRQDMLSSSYSKRHCTGSNESTADSERTAVKRLVEVLGPVVLLRSWSFWKLTIGGRY